MGTAVQDTCYRKILVHFPTKSENFLLEKVDGGGVGRAEVEISGLKTLETGGGNFDWGLGSEEWMESVRKRLKSKHFDWSFSVESPGIANWKNRGAATPKTRR